MLRAGQRTTLLFKGKNGNRIFNQKKRNLSNGSPGGSGLRTAGIVGGAVVVGCGVTVAYASSNQSFRKQVENYVPGGKPLLDTILGSSDSNVQKPVKPKPRKTVESDPFEKPLLKKNSNKAIEEGSSVAGISAVLEKQESLAMDALKSTEAGQPISSAATKENVAEQSLEYESIPIPDPEVSTPALQPTIDDSADTTSPPVMAAPSPPKMEPRIVATDKAKETTNKPKTNKAVVKAKKESSKVDGEKVLKAAQMEKNADVAASTAILEDLLSACSVACANAIVTNSAAANAVATHSSLLRTALDDAKASADEKSLQWVDVSQAMVAKDRKLDEADVTYQKAIVELAKMKNVMDQIPADDPAMKQAMLDIQQNCSDLASDLEESKSKVSRHTMEANALLTYQRLVEEAKSGLREKINLPEGRTEEGWRREGKKLSQSEEMDILRHMHRKVEELQEQLTAERESAASLLEETIATIRNDTEKQVERDAEMKMEKFLNEQRLEHEKKLVQTQRSYEQELTARLKKQTSDHAEHLAEALTYMDRQAAEKYEKTLRKELDRQQEMFEKVYEEQRTLYEEQVNSTREDFQSNLNIALARVEGITKAIDGRAHVESESRKAQELSLACDSLMVALRYGDNGLPTPLKTQVETLKKVYNNNPDIEALSNTLPAEAGERGVFPEEIIRTSFQRIAKICRRVSMVDENRNSLFIYFLSCIKSFLTISNASLEPPKEIDNSSLDVFTIISYANYCVQRGDVEQAVRFVNQLKGEPRKVAEGWLEEARLYLETKQTVAALCALSNAIVIGAQLEE